MHLPGEQLLLHLLCRGAGRTGVCRVSTLRYGMIVHARLLESKWHRSLQQIDAECTSDQLHAPRMALHAAWG